MEVLLAIFLIKDRGLADCLRPMGPVRPTIDRRVLRPGRLGTARPSQHKPPIPPPRVCHQMAGLTSPPERTTLMSQRDKEKALYHRCTVGGHQEKEAPYLDPRDWNFADKTIQNAQRHLDKLRGKTSE